MKDGTASAGAILRNTTASYTCQQVLLKQYRGCKPSGINGFKPLCVAGQPRPCIRLLPARGSTLLADRSVFSTSSFSRASSITSTTASAKDCRQHKAVRVQVGFPAGQRLLLDRAWTPPLYQLKGVDLPHLRVVGYDDITLPGLETDATARQ